MMSGGEYVYMIVDDVYDDMSQVSIPLSVRGRRIGTILKLVVVQADEVSLQHGNGDLANSGDVDGGLLLDLIAIKVLEGREVDADSTIADQVRGNLVGGRGDTGDDNIGQGQDILDLQRSLGHLRRSKKEHKGMVNG